MKKMRNGVEKALENLWLFGHWLASQTGLRPSIKALSMAVLASVFFGLVGSSWFVWTLPSTPGATLSRQSDAWRAMQAVDALAADPTIVSWLEKQKENEKSIWIQKDQFEAFRRLSEEGANPKKLEAARWMGADLGKMNRALESAAPRWTSCPGGLKGLGAMFKGPSSCVLDQKVNKFHAMFVFSLGVIFGLVLWMSAVWWSERRLDKGLSLSRFCRLVGKFSDVKNASSFGDWKLIHEERSRARFERLALSLASWRSPRHPQPRRGGRL